MGKANNMSMICINAVSQSFTNNHCSITTVSLANNDICIFDDFQDSGQNTEKAANLS